MADTVSKVPSGFHAALKRPLKLAGRYAFLGRAKQMDRLKPQAQRQMAVLEDRADPHREGLAAGQIPLKANRQAICSTFR